MTTRNLFSPKTLARDLPASVVVFLVALPLCLGIALASGAPLRSGLVAGIVGGIVIGALSGSHTSVSGPAAGLTAVVAAQIALLGSFEAFLLATFVAGVFQLLLGVVRAGFIASFFPSSVIKGLLAAIGIILILKQIPHAIGHDPDPIGEMAFAQPDNENTFSELFDALGAIQPGAALIGLLSIAVLVLWDRLQFLKKSKVPVPLVVVLLGVAINLALLQAESSWAVRSSHLVQVPLFDGADGMGELFTAPDWSQWVNPQIYVAAFTLAIVASLETLLNLDAVDSLDPEQRHSPPSRELVAQGAGNMLCGLIGGLPVTSVVIRGSVNVQAGGKTKLSAISHGVLLLVCVLAVPQLLNLIPLASLAAILLVTGFKLASPKLIWNMWRQGRAQFLPFAATVVAIVLTDLLKGIVAGLLIAIAFILHSNLRRPVKRIIEKHLAGDVLRIELGNQVSFLNRASLEETLYSVERGQHVLLDARSTDYIDPDILDLIHDFEDKIAPAHGVGVSLIGFKARYARLQDRIQFVDYSTRELQTALTPSAVLRLLQEGNRRFRSGQRLTRNLVQQVSDTADGQAPLAVVLSCIDSRTPAEIIFDLGIGDIFSVRIAGNIAEEKVLGSIEFACVEASAKLIVVLGHTHCGAVTAAVDTYGEVHHADDSSGCRHVRGLLSDIQRSIESGDEIPGRDDAQARSHYIDAVVARNVLRTMRVVRDESPALDRLIRENKLAIVAGVYDVRTGEVEFYESEGPLSEPLAAPDSMDRPLPPERTPSESALPTAED